MSSSRGVTKRSIGGRRVEASVRRSSTNGSQWAIHSSKGTGGRNGSNAGRLSARAPGWVTVQILLTGLTVSRTRVGGTNTTKGSSTGESADRGAHSAHERVVTALGAAINIGTSEANGTWSLLLLSKVLLLLRGVTVLRLLGHSGTVSAGIQHLLRVGSSSVGAGILLLLSIRIIVGS